MEIKSHRNHVALDSASFAFMTAEIKYISILKCGFTDSKLETARIELDKAKAEYLKLVGELE